MCDDSTPVLIGAGQLTQRDVDPTEAKSPAEMMADCAVRAAEDAGVRAETLVRLDSIAVANILCWPYKNAPGLVAERLGARPREQLYSTLGGNTPQWLVNRTAARIAKGEVKFALLAGAEAVHTVRRAKKPLQWEVGGKGSPTEVGDPRPGTNAYEEAHGLHLPAEVYPLFENALRAHMGLTIDEHRERLGALCAQLSAVVSGNPYAWFRQPRSATEIATVTPGNRYVGFPYTKFMNAIIDVDQAAAVLMTSGGMARQLGVPESQWIYLLGAADAHDHWFISERRDYNSSPAIRSAGKQALAMAGMDIDGIDLVELYSCFPCSVQIGRTMLGIAEDDSRRLTVTGGLAYAGGPGSNYSMHAIATMMELLRARPAARGLVTALGWYVTKHSVGVYGAEPPGESWQPADSRAIQAELDRMPKPEIEREPRGKGRIETYTVLHDHSGQPALGVVVGRDENDRRFLANTPNDRAVLEGLESAEGVGRRGKVTSKNGVNRFDPD